MKTTTCERCDGERECGSVHETWECIASIKRQRDEARAKLAEVERVYRGEVMRKADRIAQLEAKLREAEERLRTHDGWCDATGEKPYLTQGIRDRDSRTADLEKQLKEDAKALERGRATIAEIIDRCVREKRELSEYFEAKMAEAKAENERLRAALSVP